MKPYADTNFITHFYLERRESETAAKLLARARARSTFRLPVTWLLRAETINAIEQSVFAGKSQDHPRVTAEEAGSAQAWFASDLRDKAWLEQTDVPLDRVVDAFEEISLRHTARQGCRAYDILHVASARVLRCDTFWSFDSTALKLAKLEGLKTNG